MSEPWVAPRRIFVLIEKELVLISGIPESGAAPVERCLIGCRPGTNLEAFFLGPCQTCE